MGHSSLKVSLTYLRGLEVAELTTDGKAAIESNVKEVFLRTKNTICAIRNGIVNSSLKTPINTKSIL